MKRNYNLLPLILFASTVAQAQFPPPVAWQMQGNDPTRVGRSTATGPASEFTVNSCELGTRLQDNASPIVDLDGTVYVPTETDFVAVNPDCTEKWRKVYMLGKSWGMRSAPALSPDGSTVYALSSWLAYSVTALATSDGTELWSFALDPGQVSYSSFAVGGDGTIYVGNWTPALYAIWPNGTLRWRYAPGAGGAFEAPPSVDPAGNVFVIQNLVGLVALDPGGSPRTGWPAPGLGDYGWPTVSVGTDGTLYVAGEYYVNNAARAFNPNGTPKWRRDDIGHPGFFAGMAVSEDGTTAYRAAQGKVHALSTATGATIWERTIAPPEEAFGGTPALSGNRILYVMGNRGTTAGDYVYALSAATGDLLWQYQLNTPAIYWGPQSPAIAPDGTLWVVSSGNLNLAGGTISARLYAIGP